jgi:hypothetical protein
MFTDGVKRSAQIAEFRTVQVQRLDGRSACCCAPNDAHEVFAPCKVSCPLLAARVKKRHNTPCL